MNDCRIKDLVSINRTLLPESTDPDYEFKYIDISSVDSEGRISEPDDLMRFGSSPSRARRVAVPGSTVVSTVRTYLRAVALVPTHETPLAFSTGFAVLEPGSRLDSRYLAYYCQSERFIGEIVARSTGVSYPAINPTEIGNLMMPVPGLEEQWRIADFLDAETSRLDRMAAIQNKAAALVREREQAMLDVELDALYQTLPVLPLRRFISGMDQGSSPQCESVPAHEEEWGVLKVSCIRPGVFIANENKRILDEYVPNNRHEVREGDVLMTRANTPELVGSVAVVPAVRRRLLLCDKIFRIALTPGIDPHYFAVVTRGSRIRSLSAAASNGASQSMANLRFEDVKSWQIPIPDLNVQKAIVARLAKRSETMSRLTRAIERQLALLAERRQALITAAVTGKVDVTASRWIGVP